MTVMVQVYVRLIQEGRRTLESVPENLREEVEKELNQGAEQT
ncbi:CD1375 family protein [Cohnella sp. GbtcB17]|nr:CD1375 family protein [Cohnella sp. GbtcB17]